METMQTSIATAFIAGLGLGVITTIVSIIVKVYTDEKYAQLKARKEQAEGELRTSTKKLEAKDHRLKQAEALLGELKDVFKELIDELRTKNKEAHNSPVDAKTAFDRDSLREAPKSVFDALREGPVYPPEFRNDGTPSGPKSRNT